jgi:DNA-binding CsgD family transcriptional regulator
MLLFCYSFTNAQNQTDKVFSKDSYTRLNPKIKFYRNQLPFNNANEFDTSQLKNPEILSFPFALWSKGFINKKKAKDYGTILLRIELPDTKHQYYYHFERITGGCEIWVNNNHYTSFGKFSKNLEKSSSKGTALSLKLPKQKNISIALLISNSQHHWGGGINLKPKLFKAAILFKYKEVGVIKEYSALIIFLLLICYQFFMYFLYKENKYIYMASICLAFILRSIVIKNNVIYDFFPDVPFFIIQKLRYASIYMACTSILLFYWEFIPRHINKKVFTFFLSVQSLGIIGCIILPTYQVTQLAEIMRLFLIAQIIYCFWFIGIAIYKKETYAKLLMIGILFVFGCLINNVLYATQKIDTFFIVVYLPLAFLLPQTIINHYIQKENQKKLLYLKTNLDINTKENQKLKLETLSRIQEKEKIKTSLKEIPSKTSELKSVLAFIQSKSNEDEKAKLLKGELEIDLTNFTNNLHQKHPSLTKTDIEIAIYIVLGKTRQEIADLRGITISSAKTSRTRLRKKLELPKETLLDNYLKSLQENSI